MLTCCCCLLGINVGNPEAPLVILFELHNSTVKDNHMEGVLASASGGGIALGCAQVCVCECVIVSVCVYVCVRSLVWV